MIPRSMLDDDLYKFTMQQAACVIAPDEEAVYRYTNRGGTPVPETFARSLREEIDSWADLALQPDESAWLSSLPFIKPWYVKYLEGFRYDPAGVNIGWNDGQMSIDIRGPWHERILWEVKLMYTICELYFSTVDTNWNREGEIERAEEKAARLNAGVDFWADFATRRRRDFEAQENFVKVASKYPKSFMGTSNCYLAMKYGLRPIGTMAHEWIQAMSALFSILHANRMALRNWHKVYDGSLGIALTDTFGTDCFFRDFDAFLAKLHDGVRHDSGDPFAFADRVIEHYKSLKIDPLSKTIVFSDGLDVDKAIEIAEYCSGRILTSFGIGTHFSNHFYRPDNSLSPALNIVIKLVRLNGMDVVKLSDVLTKAIGERDALRVVRYICQGIPLDQEVA